MFSHIMVGVSDFQRAMAFYTPVLQALGVQFRFLEEDRPWAGW
jgi:catechol 2,3-dioxygenase-like lactoylglutathione lyase family enzyme